MSSVGEELPKEIKRVSALRDEYLSLPGGVGFIASEMMRVSIENAIRVQSEGDVISILRAYEELKGFTG